MRCSPKPAARVDRTVGRTLCVALIVLLGAMPALAFQIYLRDGTMIAAREKFTIDGDLALVTLENGTQTTIRLTEIDLEKTERLNQRAYTSAVVIEGSRERLLALDDPATRQRTLAEYVRERQVERAERSSAPGSNVSPRRLRLTPAGFVDLRALPRELAEDATATKIAETVRSHGVVGARVFLGSARGRYLLDVTTDSEATVLRVLEGLAAAILELADAGADVAALEVYMANAEGSRAGMFTLTEEMSSLLVSDQLEPSQFFLQFVEF